MNQTPPHGHCWLCDGPIFLPIVIPITKGTYSWCCQSCAVRYVGEPCNCDLSVERDQVRLGN